MSDDTPHERRDAHEENAPTDGTKPPKGGWEGPQGGPDDVDAVHDLSGFPDLSYRQFRWKR